MRACAQVKQVLRQKDGHVLITFLLEPVRASYAGNNRSANCHLLNYVVRGRHKGDYQSREVEELA